MKCGNDQKGLISLKTVKSEERWTDKERGLNGGIPPTVEPLALHCPIEMAVCYVGAGGFTFRYFWKIL